MQLLLFSRVENFSFIAFQSNWRGKRCLEETCTGYVTGSTGSSGGLDRYLA